MEPTLPVIDSKKEANAGLIQIYVKNLKKHWFRRWDEALKMFYQTYQKYNIELERIYIQGKNAYPVQFRSLTDFLIQYQGCIFSNAQMINLLSRFEEVGPDKVC